MRISDWSSDVCSSDLLGQMAAHAFGEEGVFRMEFKARGIIRLVAAVARHPHVAGCDALDRTILVIEDFGGGKAGEDFNAQPFGLFGVPAAKIAEASSIGALIEIGRASCRERECQYV